MRRATDSARLGGTVGAFGDLFFPGGGEIDVRATMTLLPDARCARRSDSKIHWRPNHNFGAQEDRVFYIGQVEFDQPGTIEIGQTRDVLVRFMDGPGLKEQLLPGRSWRVQEGLTLVATARVIEVLGET